MTPMQVLNQIASDLEAVTGVVSSKVGLEPNISPADYPMIRVVPSEIGDASAYSRRKLDVLVYYGAKIHAFSGMAAVYAALLAMEAEIITIMESGTGGYIGVFQKTITDEDRLDTYKLFASRFMVEA